MSNKAASPQLSQDIVKDRAFIGGQWIAAKSGASFDVINPANNDIIISVPDMNAEDTCDAISHADKAFKTWSKLHPSKRAEIMFRWSDLILKRADDLAMLMTAE
ncbi:MAG: succinate-semialdehyde dehydrogenase (NADP(+)), partial [Micavibrio aeruginosavorus]